MNLLRFSWQKIIVGFWGCFLAASKSSQLPPSEETINTTIRPLATLAAATHRLKSGKAKGTHKLESTVSVLRKRNQQTQLTRQSLLDTKPRWVWLSGDVCVVLLFGFCGNDQSSLFCARTVRTLHAQSVLRPHPNETMDQSAKKVF